MGDETADGQTVSEIPDETLDEQANNDITDEITDGQTNNDISDEIPPEDNTQNGQAEVFCGLAEHIHGDGCYMWECVMPGEHDHRAVGCIELGLICAVSEHIHSLLCEIYTAPDTAPEPDFE